jgi:hypothetical protein
MAPFEELQELWQRQDAPPVPARDLALLSSSLRSYGRRQTYINAAKALIVTAVLAWSVSRVGVTWRTAAGFGLIGVAALAILARDWRGQRIIAQLDFSAPSLAFVRDAIARIDEQRRPLRGLYWPFMGALVIGMNLTLAGTHRLWLRLLASCLPFLAFEAGMWVRRKRFELECRPLIERLSAMRAALEENPD